MKKQLRKQYLNIRKLIPHKEEKSMIITNKIISSPIYKQANTIALYYSLADEVQTLSLIKQALADHKQVCLPKVISKTEMSFYEITSLHDLEKGSFHIYEPMTNHQIDSFDFMIVPGVCFDNNGNRIGFGGGYYDRYLKSQTCKTIGICFKEQVIDFINTEENDIKIDEIVTD